MVRVEALNSQETVDMQTPGFIGRVPIRNLWLLMLYASELFRTNGLGRFEVEDSPEEIPDLVAEVLAYAVELRLRRRLSVGFYNRHAIVNRVRGRIDVLTTERRQLLHRGMVACRFNELTIDTPRNRFVRHALETVSRIVSKNKIAHRCRSLAGRLEGMGVIGLPPTRAQMNMDCCGRNDSDDQQMVAAAKLAFDLALPTERDGSQLLNRAERDEVWVRRLFEGAVGGFYSMYLPQFGWQVKCGKTLSWHILDKSDLIDKILPSMKTDIILDHPVRRRRIVIDTKFTSLLTKGWYREETLRSGYVYQMYAYLLSQVGQGDDLANCASGLLLHPTIDCMIDENVNIQGHSIRFATVNLCGSPLEIKKRLLELVIS